MGSWQVFLANSSDLTRNADITSQAHDLQLDLALNQAGSCSFNLPLSTEFTQYLDPIRDCVIVQKNKAVVWSGMIWSKEEDFTGAKISISAVGWYEILHKRYSTANTLTYTNKTSGFIIKALVDATNAHADTWINTTTGTDTQVRTVTVEKLSNIGDQIQQLTALENGCDVKVNPVTRNLIVSGPTDFTVTNIAFGFNVGPANVVSANRTTTGDDMANEQYVQGANITAFAENSISKGTGPFGEGQTFQNVISVTEVVDPVLLGAIANAEVAVNGYPRVLIDFVPKGIDINNTFNMPSIFEDYDIGDQVTISVKKDGSTINGQAVRIFSASLAIDNNGTEKINSLSTTYQSS